MKRSSLGLWTMAFIVGFIGCGGESGQSDQTGCIGAEGCDCTAGQGCDPGLTCLSEKCVALPDGSVSVGDAAAENAVGPDASSPGEGATPQDDESQLQGGYAPSANEGPLDPGGSACAGPPAALHIDVPWLPQVPPGQWSKTMNCGPAAFAMIDGYFSSTTPGSDTIKEIDDWLAANVAGWQINGYNGNPQGTTTTQLATLASGYGVYANAAKFSGATCDDLLQELKGGRPVIVTVDTQPKNDLPSTTLKSGHGHFMVLGGMDSQHVYLYDPGRSTADQGCGEDRKGRKFTLDSFYKVWSSRGRSGTFIRKDSTSGCACGNGVCEAACNETCSSCELDCGCGACQQCGSSNTCVPKDSDCGTKKCGVDSCGNSCGTCPTGSSCVNSQCVLGCPANCSGHGTCNQQNGECTCTGGWSGPDCATAPAPVCSVQASPQTTTGTSQPNCTCSSSNPSCHSLYQGAFQGVDSNGPNGPRATVNFSKLAGGTMSAGTQYWITVVAPSVTPACTDLNIYQVRANGTFSGSSSSQAVSFDVWPSKAAYEAAPNGDQKCFLLITDGSTTPGQRMWFQPQTMCFTKGCS